jgi:hypothetical protein
MADFFYAMLLESVEVVFSSLDWARPAAGL